ncbi:MAG TPA: tRNA pseudouridine(38-40) synthase TruA [Gaiellaceae bacterium]|nr:tRNA pseudouridine(38-40) synthase TruA [Gaiellaceae bacterium]
MNLKLTLAYDGTAFRGWSRQPGERTVEGVLGAALETTYGSYEGLVIGGRTDTGVHAIANVASVHVSGGPPPERAAEAMNAVLPVDVAIVRAEGAPPEFHARHSARSRSYRYRIWRGRTRSPFEANRSLWHPQPLELQRLHASAAMFVGRHDFRAFTPTETQHKVFTRTVEDARWHDRGDTVELEITADSFLRHMVRTLVGTMLEVEPDRIVDLLQGAPRAESGSTAAACGLYLVEIGYDKPSS